MRIGVDVGGTFTDVTAIDHDGGFHIAKLPSTPQDQSLALRDGVGDVLSGTATPAGAVRYLGHGTTVATNTLLELDGSSAALIVTEGFRDLLEIARQKRPSLYDLAGRKPRILVPRALTFEVAERVGASGKVLRELSDDEVARVVEQVREAGVEAVAICLLHSYRDDRHERAIADALAMSVPQVYVSRSSEVAPEFREFERMSTTVINAFVGPRMHRYVTHLADRTADLGIPVAPRIIQSNGGLVSPDSVSRRPVTTLLSGPSAGVAGAAWVAGLAGHRDVITFDMGGTSTDVCLISGGKAVTTAERSIEGYVVRVPSASVHTVGAGGGSIAGTDDAGALQVGPRSAGARPGPAAYGHGGDRATVTDANIVLGRQNPREGLGSAMPIDAAAAQAVVAEVGHPLGFDVPEAATGIVRLANSHMARAVRAVSVEIGEDPRDYALVAYGGAGPLHAVEVAREVGITTVLVPPHPGTLCALGLLVSDVRATFVQSVLAPLSEEALTDVTGALERLDEQATDWFDREQVPEADRRTVFTLALRYGRQNFELDVDLPPGRLDAAVLPEVAEAFHATHERTYGFRHADAGIRVVNATVTASQRTDPPVPGTLPDGDGDPARALRETRPVVFGGRELPTPVYDRSRLMQGDRLDGPAVIEQMDSTVVLTPGSHAVVDTYGVLHVEVGTDA
ncbi:hydantoinase/oxoprolinase family protein [Pseudonocardia nematodicida]|uniref:Hydantoinase/oxoprolinase family protein n=1 Tax=Pseudonocardia nematodicida TaxID=1206997 RepID=A0ABV1K4I3_9PSEU